MKSKNIHIYPVNDKLPHYIKGLKCICHPKIKEGLIVHNSFDGREYKEKDNNLLGENK